MPKSSPFCREFCSLTEKCDVHSPMTTLTSLLSNLSIFCHSYMLEIISLCNFNLHCFPFYWNLWMQRAVCRHFSVPFYIKGLNIHGFCINEGSWNQSSLSTGGLYLGSGGVKSYIGFSNAIGILPPCSSRDNCTYLIFWCFITNSCVYYKLLF